MQVRFYGVRGSIATAGDETLRYGGNTACVAVDVDGAGGAETLIFDAGTGIRKLGAELARGGPGAVRAHLFFSHLHWDHIQGFPFFSPAFVPGNQLSIYAVDAPVLTDATEPATLTMTLHDGVPVVDGGQGIARALASQMTAPHFPVGLDAMRAELRFFDVPLGERILLGRGGAPVVVRHAAVDHPNGCVAYRVEQGGKSVVYATDLELAEGKGGAVFDALVELSRNADVLVFDAMYTPEEYEGKGTFSRRGWGHSTFEMGAAVADAANVAELCLFHHDPSHDDAFMDALADRARARRAGTTVAREGMVIRL